MEGDVHDFSPLQARFFFFFLSSGLLHWLFLVDIGVSLVAVSTPPVRIMSCPPPFRRMPPRLSHVCVLATSTKKGRLSSSQTPSGIAASLSPIFH